MMVATNILSSWNIALNMKAAVTASVHLSVDNNEYN